MAWPAHLAADSTLTGEPRNLPAVTKHLKVLQRAGLISQGRRAQWRPCRLEAAPLKTASDWIDGYREFWEQGLDRLDDYLRKLKKDEKPFDENV